MKYLSLLGLFWLSCTNQAESPPLTTDSAQQDGTELNDTASIVRDSPVSEKPHGFFRAMLPCKDCKGVEHTVLFGAGQSFRLEERHVNKERIQSSSGPWRMSGDSIFLLHKNPSQKMYYLFRNDSLLHYNASGMMTPMQQLPAAIDNQAWRNKAKEGFELYGVGNEPFWNIKIDEQKGIAFHQAEWSKPLYFENVKVNRTNDSAVFIAGTEPARLTVVLYTSFCNDGMSDYIYSHKVKVLYENNTFHGCGIVYK